MSKNEIRLRRQKLTSRGAERFRNYGAVLERHEKEVRLKKIIKAFSMFLIILIVIVLLVIIVRIEKRTVNKKKTASITWVSPVVPWLSNSLPDKS